jgi:flagellar basal body-associated protein FliL
MNKKSIWLIGLIIVFTLATVWLGFFNAEQASEIDEEVLIIKTSKETIEITLLEIMAFTKVSFETQVKSSGNDPVATEFGGVLLYDILIAKGILLIGEETIVFKALDGYQTSVSAQEVKQPDNVYVVYERNKEKTTNRASQGTGPMEIVVALDNFSQRWNKHLIEIEIVP